MALLSELTLGFLSDLIAQHVYNEATPAPAQRRRFNLTGFTIADDSVNEWLDIKVGQDVTVAGEAAMLIEYEASTVTGDAIGIDINELSSPSAQSILGRFRQNATTVFEIIADASSYAELNSPTEMALQIADTDKVRVTATETHHTVPVELENNIAVQGETTGGTARDLAKVDGSDENVLGNQTQITNLDGSTQIDLRIGGTDRLALLAAEARFIGVAVFPLHDGTAPTTGAVNLRNGDWIASIDVTDTNTINTLRVDGNDNIQLGDGTNVNDIVLTADRAIDRQSGQATTPTVKDRFDGSITTNATPDTYDFPIASDTSVIAYVTVIGRSTTDGDTLGFARIFHCENTAGTVTVVNADTGFNSAEDGGWGGVGVAGSGANIRVTVTGQGGDTIEWRVNVKTVEYTP